MRGVLKPASERIANDAYYTPPALARAICELLDDLLPTPGIVLEPNCGAGAFVIAAREVWNDSMTVFLAEDIDEKARATVSALALAGVAEPGGHGAWPDRCDVLAVGNPPFNEAEEQVQLALNRVGNGSHVAFLLRLSFLGGLGRLHFYRQHPLEYLIPIAGRPSFTADGKTDASEYALFVWKKGSTAGGRVLAPLTWARNVPGSRKIAKRGNPVEKQRTLVEIFHTALDEGDADALDKLADLIDPKAHR